MKRSFSGAGIAISIILIAGLTSFITARKTVWITLNHRERTEENV